MSYILLANSTRQGKGVRMGGATAFYAVQYNLAIWRGGGGGGPPPPVSAPAVHKYNRMPNHVRFMTF